MPKTWMLESILATLFCCWAIGLVGIFKAWNVKKLYKAGDYAGAKQASEEAAKFVKWSVIVGIIVAVISFFTTYSKMGVS